MRSLVALAVVLATSGAVAAERRCGWLINPTPANWWLRDRDGEWTIGLMGAEDSAQFPDDTPDLRRSGWVRTNGSYGYGCACLTVETDRAAMKIRTIVSAESRPLGLCRADTRLGRPG